MKWAWQVGTIKGIPIRVHVTFLFALIWGAFVWGGGADGLLWGGLLTVALFGLVLLHELGHALAAQRYGIDVNDIVLLPIGGVARLSRMPDELRQELVVALAGPAVNAAMLVLVAPAVIISLAGQATSGGPLALPATSIPGVANFVAFLVLANVSLLLFNMLPAFPMDGGRVLRALLALRLSYVKATNLAVVVGRVFAVGFAVAGIASGSFGLALVALFVFFGAGTEGQQVNFRERLLELKVTEALNSDAPTLPADLPVHLAFDRLVRSPYSALAVVDHSGGFLGMVNRVAMQQAWAKGVRGPVALFAERPTLVFECATPLAQAVERMTAAQVHVAPVYCGSSFAGMLDVDTIARVINARGGGSRSAPHPV
jgi:Zn-dependent protease